jgi:hypothetical protein
MWRFAFLTQARADTASVHVGMRCLQCNFGFSEHSGTNVIWAANLEQKIEVLGDLGDLTSCLARACFGCHCCARAATDVWNSNINTTRPGGWPGHQRRAVLLV